MRITLTVSDSTLVVEGLDLAPLVLPFGEDVSFPPGGSTMKVKAVWDGPILVLERSLGDVKIVDRYEALGAGERILATRRVSGGGPRGTREATVGYDRVRAGDGGS